MSGYPNIRCSFIVWGKVDNKFWQVDFLCHEVIEFHLENEECFELGDRYLVLETDVTGKSIGNVPLDVRQRITERQVPEHLWYIYIFGEATLKMTCLEFDFEVRELTDAEYQGEIA